MSRNIYLGTNWNTGTTICLGIGIALLFTSLTAQTRDQMTTKNDFANIGFTIVLPSEESFEQELHKLGFDQNLDIQTLKPFSIVLKNSSNRSIVAFAIRWTISDASGHVTTHDQSYVDPGGLLDGVRKRREGGNIEHQIRHNSSRFLTLGGMARSPDELRGLAESRSSGAGQFSVVSATIDAAIFDNGEVIGPDKLGMVGRFKARVDAEQDLMTEIHSRLGLGETLRNILIDADKQTKPDSEKVPITAADTYEATRRSLINELITTQLNYGDEMALRTVEYRRCAIRPVIAKH
jgi:hypothetical protein